MGAQLSRNEGGKNYYHFSRAHFPVKKNYELLLLLNFVQYIIFLGVYEEGHAIHRSSNACIS